MLDYNDLYLVRDKVVGYHMLADIKFENNTLLYSTHLNYWKTTIKKLLEEHNNQILGDREHIFNNLAFSWITLLAESHFSIHTWPEINLVSIDYYTCNLDDDIQKFYDDLLNVLGEKTKIVDDNCKIVLRGVSTNVETFVKQTSIYIERWNDGI